MKRHAVALQIKSGHFVMSWYMDDVDWITGEHHNHIVRIGYHG